MPDELCGDVDGRERQNHRIDKKRGAHSKPAFFDPRVSDFDFPGHDRNWEFKV